MKARDMLADVEEAERIIASGRVVPPWMAQLLCKHVRRLRDANLDLLGRVTMAELVAERRHEQNGGHRRVA